MNFLLELDDLAHAQLKALDADRRRFIMRSLLDVLCVDPVRQSVTTGRGLPRDRFFETMLRQEQFEHRFGVELSVDETQCVVYVATVTCATYAV